MYKFNFFAITIPFLLASSVSTQAQKAVPSKAGRHTIPFQLTSYNNLSVPAILNNQDTVYLMFHTAANSVTITEEGTQKIKSLRFDGADTVKSWGGSANTARVSNNNRLQIGDLEWMDLPIWENKNSGQGTVGKFGPDLFRNKVIEIDFDKHIMVIHEKLPAGTHKYDKLKATFENDLLFIEAACTIGDSTFPNKFLVHSGYGGAVLLDDQFVNTHSLAAKLKIVSTKELKDSYGNVLKTQKAILPAFTIGRKTLTEVPVSFFEGAIGRQKMSIIGGDILKRFHIIIDARREYVYLKPNKLTGSKYADI